MFRSAPYIASDVWVFVEQTEGRIEQVSLEILGRAASLAEPCGWRPVAILMGQDLEPLAEEVLLYGADAVIAAEDPLLATYTTDAYTSVLEDIISRRVPGVLLMGATYNGRDLAGRLAVRLRTGLTADVVRLDMSCGGQLTAYTPGLGGRILAACECPEARPQMATVRPGVFPVPEPRDVGGNIHFHPVSLNAADIRTEVLERCVGETADLTSAERVVVAGLGTGGDLDLVRRLAAALDAQVGVTRPLADEGLVARDYQIGTTGVSVRPDLLFVVGASGALHFTSGIEEAGTVVAVNSDPEAEIFRWADYCAVDDLFQVLPPLIEKLEASAAKPAVVAEVQS